ncbi:lamin tail domain-containing protein [Microcoleus sp. herbarium2]|uniref:lamin tail domain-containing protein n=1 Tax=Microcoleus sp. herbarium2 TaxID=3055433 RepID=UPI002FD300B7
MGEDFNDITSSIKIEKISPVAPAPALTPEVTSAPAPTPEPQGESQTPDESESEEVINEFVEAETTGTATGVVAISDIAYKGKVKRTQSDEYIEITNKGTTPADLSGWKVMSGLSKKQSFTFPAGTSLAAGQSFRVYTNEVHPETGGFSIGSSTGIWNDKGDEGKLFDAQGNQVSTLAYGLSGIPGIKAELGVPKLIVQASPSGVNKQMALQGKVTFIQAVKLAITNFLEDDNDPESPLALILAQPDAYGLPEGVDKAAATQFLRSHLNQPTVKMLLHTPKMGSAPENGETIADNWIFQLDLDDGVIHWAIIDRSGVKAPYNYGFR